MHRIYPVGVCTLRLDGTPLRGGIDGSERSQPPRTPRDSDIGERAAVIPIALATDTFSIAVMEIVDNAIMLTVPGAMESGASDILFWGALSFALAIAGIVAFPVNRWLITRGKGHAVLHATGIHGGPPTKAIAAIAAVAFVFGATVLIAEAVNSDDDNHGGGHSNVAGRTQA